MRQLTSWRLEPLVLLEITFSLLLPSVALADTPEPGANVTVRGRVFGMVAGLAPGPVLSREGKFLGLVVSKNRPPRGMNTALSSNRIRKRLSEWSRKDVKEPPVPEIKVRPRATFGMGGFSYTDTAYAFSPDGRYFAVGGYCNLLLRDARTGKEVMDLGEELEKEKVNVCSVAFSPDSQTLAVGNYGGAIHIWDLRGQKWGAALKGHTGSAQVLAFSPDGRTLASGGDDGTLRLWDVRTSRETACKKPHGRWVFVLVFTGDGKRLVSAGANHDVLVWDVATMKPQQRLRGHDNAVDALALAAGDTLLASSSRDGTSKLWDLRSGKEMRTFAGAVGMLSADGRWWIARAWSGLTVWDAATGERRARIPPPVGIFLPVSMLLSPDGRTLAVRCDSERIHLWDLKRLLPAEKMGRIDAMAFSPDGKELASLDSGRTLRLWNVATGKQLQRIDLVLEKEEKAVRVGYAGQDPVVLLEEHRGSEAG